MYSEVSLQPHIQVDKCIIKPPHMRYSLTLILMMFIKHTKKAVARNGS